jgi:F-type H+-transporting ATPase subunit delta
VSDVHEAHSGSAVLRCATPPGAEELAALGAEIRAWLGREVAFTVAVDPTLIGGYVLLIDGKLYDFSIAARLQQIKQALHK